jgi:DNA-binding MarR family transcriptional regulator
MDWYRGFAERQLKVHRSKTAEQSVRFFRQSINHTLLWTSVMRGYYRDQPPTVKEIILQSRCSKETVRKIIARARLKGYLEATVSDADRRRRLVRPTRLTVAEYERLIDGYRSFFCGRAK